MCTSSHNFRLDGILRVPDLASNLLSVHKLYLQNNAFCYFDAYRFSIQDLPIGKILYERLSKDGVYPIPASSFWDSASSSSPLHQIESVSAFTSVKSTQISLLHKRLGHPSAKLLQSAIQSVNHDFSFNKVDECCSCFSAKMHKFPLNKHKIQSTSMLQIVHFDVWGTIPITSLFGYNY